MSKNTIEDLFKDLREEFDFSEPNANHKQRFLQKLKKNSNPNKQFSWKPILAVAASLLLFFVLIFNISTENITNDLASVSPELSETQDYFANTIAEELNKLQQESSPETKAIISDAMHQLKILETDYENLKKDLDESGDDKRVIHAMITNFQNRIDLLQQTLQRIENIKQLKIDYNENSSTI